MEKNKRFRSNFIWNMLGTGFNAFNSLFLLIAVTRINGINDAGIFTIAFSTACILYVVGIYAGRVFQVTDSNKNVTDIDYIYNRVFSCSIMIILTIVFVILKKYDIYKSTIFILLSFYKCFEAFSDVLYGIMQKRDLLNIVGKSYFIKGLLSVFTFVLVDIITKNMIFSCISIIIIWIAVLIFYDIKNIKKLVDFETKINFNNISGIFKNGFFVFAITFLGLYIMNAPKYAIDNFLTEDIQAIFGIIIMPATVMALVGQFVMHPYLNDIVDLYNNGEIRKLKILISKIIIYIVAFGIIASFLAYFLGTQVLTLIYGIDLSSYQIHLVAIIIAATLYNIGIIYSSVLTTIRKTFIQFIVYILVSLVALIFSYILTLRNGINGAVLSYFLIMFLQFTLYMIITNNIINRLTDKNL